MPGIWNSSGGLADRLGGADGSCATATLMEIPFLVIRSNDDANNGARTLRVRATFAGARGAAEDQRQVFRVVHARERGQPAAGADAARAPAEDSAIDLVDARGDLAVVFDRPLLDVHVHLARGEVERAHVDVAADELEREPVAGDEEPGLARAGDGRPDALELVQVGTGFRVGRGLGHGGHNSSPVTNTGRGPSSRGE